MQKIRDTAEIEIYNIEGIIDFDPVNNVLTSENAKISLPSAASAILLVLIKNHGQLVSQSDLIYEGWEKFGLHASNNTFYQNILNLRKGIRQCGTNVHIIKTVQRKGLTIPLSVSINVTSPCKKAATDEEDTGISSGDNREVINAEIPDEKPSPSPTQKISLLSKPVFLIYAIIAVLGLLAGGYGGIHKNYTANYHYLDIMDGCQVYAGKNNNISTSYERLLEKDNITCANNEYLYFTTFQYIPRTSIIKCTGPLERDVNNTCTSYYYLDG